MMKVRKTLDTTEWPGFAGAGHSKGSRSSRKTVPNGKNKGLADWLSPCFIWLRE